jgi:TM2 domain-containing membrane protein YozV
VRAAERLVPEENPSRVIYGIIAIAALLAAESGLHETYLDTVASAAIAAVLYWFAHAYAELLGLRLALHERLTVGALGRALAHEAAILRGALVPLAVLAVGWIVGAQQQTAVTAALWSAIASLLVFELIAGLRAHASARELAFEGCIGAAMGVAIIALKIVLH